MASGDLRPAVEALGQSAKLIDMIGAALSAAAPAEKCALVSEIAEMWPENGMHLTDLDAPVHAEPGTPSRPCLLAPRDMPKRRQGRSRADRAALLHALAHIELNAINLALDIILRFGHAMPPAFCTDWIGVAADEARHFNLLCARLKAFDVNYGDLPAHAGLWEAAEKTRDDILARLAIVPMVLEARGLDVSPPMIARLRSFGDDESADVLAIIYHDEIGHVGVGVRWFRHVCAEQALDPVQVFHDRVRRDFTGGLKPPFNDEARTKAGFSPQFYRSLTLR
ncbi:MAG: ferritin-like domain-containing protein [Pseudomonadota bacterium]